MPRGYRLALMVVAAEFVVGLGLLSDSTAILAMLVMPLVGVAFLLVGYVMFGDLREDATPSLAGLVTATITCLIGFGCLALVIKWAVLGLAAK